MKRQKVANKKNVANSDAWQQNTGIYSTKTSENTLKRFEEIKQKNEEKAKQLDYKSSSDEEELNEVEILDGIFKNYSDERPTKTKIFLENFFQSGSAICLICIETVRRADSIWSCKNCYCFFHLNCLKRWANDSVAVQKLNAEQNQSYYNNLGEFVPKKIKVIQWCCPKCRKEYSPDEIPRIYECFCGKEPNPANHPWLIPHSCGEKCEKYLMPECGHKCLLLCHPGPCPPCPQNLTTSCECQKSAPKMIRCFQQNWKCDMKCGETLRCGIHKCEKICHEKGKCPPCSKRSKQKCQCNSEISDRNCSDSMWHCKKVCNKPFPCELHKCKKICHSGDCGQCPLGLPRACPCGKNKSVAPCSEIVDTCGDTCQKRLTCGLHYCAQRCHKGDCSLCLAIVEKFCHCGQHKKEHPCSKIFTCETKCKLVKDCGKHSCSRKCCDGQCPPCDKICNKNLSCNKHKCKSICHNGKCYPCDLKSTVKCRCGSTFVTVPCGREKKTKIPKCTQPCKISSKCHHQNPHKCHMNDCPTCVQKCGLRNTTTGCEHPCDAKCHSAVKKETKKETIWDWQQETVQYEKQPHPPCSVKVTVRCIGGHEMMQIQCWNAKPYSCQRLCERKLKCGNHNCSRVCHSVSEINNDNEQEGCIECTETCKIPRPTGCIHPCRKRCHSTSPCDLCTANIKTNCHCGLSQVYFKCNEFYPVDLFGNDLSELQEKLKSCGDRCQRNYKCGHRCTSICHSGVCPDPDKCKKKMKIYCVCKNLKMDILCERYRNGMKFLQCDQSCTIKLEEQNRLRAEEEIKQKQIENERNRIELEQFEKKFGKKKYKERKTIEQIEQNNNTLFVWIGIGILVAISAALSLIYFNS